MLPRGMTGALEMACGTMLDSLGNVSKHAACDVVLQVIAINRRS